MTFPLLDTNSEPIMYAKKPHRIEKLKLSIRREILPDETLQSEISMNVYLAEGKGTSSDIYQFPNLIKVSKLN